MTNRLLVWVLLGLLFSGAAGGAWLTAALVKKYGPDNRMPTVKVSPIEQAKQDLTKAVTIGLKSAPSRVEVTALPGGEQGWQVNIVGKSTQKSAVDIVNDAVRALAEISRTGVPIAGVSLSLQSDEMRDIYGHRQEITATRISLTRDVFQKIEWSGFNPVNIAIVANDFWLHPALRQEFAMLKTTEGTIQDDIDAGDSKTQSNSSQGQSGNGG